MDQKLDISDPKFSEYEHTLLIAKPEYKDILPGKFRELINFRKHDNIHNQ